MIEFGDEYRDTVTGYTGKVAARTETIHNTTSVCLERADSDGKPEEVWLPIERIERVNGQSPRRVGL